MWAATSARSCERMRSWRSADRSWVSRHHHGPNTFTRPTAMAAVARMPALGEATLGVAMKNTATPAATSPTPSTTCTRAAAIPARMRRSATFAIGAGDDPTAA